jgi:hypothetical protein
MIISPWILPRMRNISDKSCTENENTHFMFHNSTPPPNPPWKSCHLQDTVEKYDTARQATDDNIIQHIHLACRITKVWIQTHTHSEHLIQYLLLLHNDRYANAPQCYAINILPVLFNIGAGISMFSTRSHITGVHISWAPSGPCDSILDCSA